MLFCVVIIIIIDVIMFIHCHPSLARNNDVAPLEN